jgi:hypothetical protein
VSFLLWPSEHWELPFLKQPFRHFVQSPVTTHQLLCICRHQKLLPPEPAGNQSLRGLAVRDWTIYLHLIESLRD